MAKVFLDTNTYLDLAYRKPEIRSQLNSHQVFISPLSIHILCYINKIRIPNTQLEIFQEEHIIVTFSPEIVKKALDGPTPDFEDNVQLHSAAEANCDFFLTEDKKLLDMVFFGKLKLVEQLTG